LNRPVDLVDYVGFGARGPGRPPRYRLPKPPRPWRPKPPPESEYKPTPVNPPVNPGAPPTSCWEGLYSICKEVFLPPECGDWEDRAEIGAEIALAAKDIPCGSVRTVNIIVNGIVETPTEGTVIVAPGTIVRTIRVEGAKDCKCCPARDKKSGPEVGAPPPRKEP